MLAGLSAAAPRLRHGAARPHATDEMPRDERAAGCMLARGATLQERPRETAAVYLARNATARRQRASGHFGV